MWFDVAQWALVAIGGGVLFRLQGAFGGSRHSRTARLVWACGIAAAAACLFQSLPLLALAPGFIVGAYMGWSRYVDLGRDSKVDDGPLAPMLNRLDPSPNDLDYDLLGLAVRGLIITLPVGLQLQAMGYPWGVLYVPAGILMACAYWIGWMVPSVLPGLRRGVQVGEALFGATLAVLLFAILR